MGIKVGKKEKALLIVLGILIYVYAFLQFSLFPTLPEIQEKNKKISELNKKIEMLNSELASIETKKLDLLAKKGINENMNQFIMPNANVIDSLDFVNKISGILGKNLKDVVLSKPKIEKSNGGKDYYVYSVKFSSDLNFNDAMDLLKYLEYGARKVVVKGLKFEPSIMAKTLQNQQMNGGQQNNQQADTNQLMANLNDLCSITIDANFYSTGTGINDKYYEYARYKLNNFEENSQNPIILKDLNEEKKKIGG